MNAPLCILIAALGQGQAEVALAALEASGYVCVPLQPTVEMLEAGWAPAHMENAENTWKEMIEAFIEQGKVMGLEARCHDSCTQDIDS
jgi:hypothetical protein